MARRIKLKHSLRKREGSGGGGCFSTALQHSAVGR
jgi:hypothetical protein